MLRFTLLASGSTGNATLIETREPGSLSRPTRVLVDCGLTLRDLKLRLAMRGVAIEDIDAVFVTHEHSDHVGCLRSLVLRHAMRVVTSEGTWHAASRVADLPPPSSFARDGDAVTVGALQLHCFAVPHDAAEPMQLVASDGHRRLGIATDLGCVNAHVIQALSKVDALVLEANHDETMLANGPYPYFLRRRIGGDYGHLANRQATRLLATLAHDRLGPVVAAHLSLHNNLPALAAAAFAQVLGRAPNDIVVASASTGTPWIDAAGIGTGARGPLRELRVQQPLF